MILWAYRKSRDQRQFLITRVKIKVDNKDRFLKLDVIWLHLFKQLEKPEFWCPFVKCEH